MDTLFISYRREESAGHAGRIYDRLRERFGRERVFMDVTAIEPGVDFYHVILRGNARQDIFFEDGDRCRFFLLS